jgi:hypothetical protein
MSLKAFAARSTPYSGTIMPSMRSASDRSRRLAASIEDRQLLVEQFRCGRPAGDAQDAIDIGAGDHGLVLVGQRLVHLSRPPAGRSL